MRVRVLVIVAFLGMAAVPLVLAWNAGFIPGPQQASAGSAGQATTSSAAITSLVWPAEPLGLAATESKVIWEQRDPSAGIAGLWYYDVRLGEKQQLLGRGSTGKSSGFPSAAGSLVVWSAWTGRRGEGDATIQALDTMSTRRWKVADAGRDPKASGELVLWIEPDGAGPGDDLIRAVNALTDEESSISPGGQVTDYAAWRDWAAWVSGSGASHGVWAGSFHGPTRYRLAAAGSAVAIDRSHIVWAAAAGRHSTTIVSWDRRSSRSTVLCRVPGVASSLSLSRGHAVWVTTRKSTGPKVWTYDFTLGKAAPVSDSAGRQVSPVIVGETVYWADDRSGHWELYSSSLQH